MSKILNWGQCDIFVRKYNGETKGTAWTKFDTPAEGSTTLETTDGEKTEAKIEGGENEAVRRAKNTYALKFDERVGANWTAPIDDVDGVIDGEYEALLYPTENPTAPALYIAKSSASASDTYSSADGTKKTYTLDALKNSIEVGKTGAKKPLGQIAWGTAVLTNDAPTSFTAFKDESKTNLLGN